MPNRAHVADPRCARAADAQAISQRYERRKQRHANLDYLLRTLKLSSAGHQSGGQNLRGVRHRAGVDQGHQRRL